MFAYVVYVIWQYRCGVNAKFFVGEVGKYVAPYFLGVLQLSLVCLLRLCRVLFCQVWRRGPHSRLMLWLA